MEKSIISVLIAAIEQMAQRVLGLRNALADKTGAIMAAAEELAASETIPDSIQDWDGWP